LIRVDVEKSASHPLSRNENPVLKSQAGTRPVSRLRRQIVTVPAKVLTLWAEKNFPMPEAGFQYHSSAKPIPYEELDLTQPWEKLNIDHELTTKGLEKFAADYRKTLAKSAGSTDTP
jgi:hypothetical protein